jgi:hypothetical protein
MIFLCLFLVMSLIQNKPNNNFCYFLPLSFLFFYAEYPDYPVKLPGKTASEQSNTNCSCFFYNLTSWSQNPSPFPFPRKKKEISVILGDEIISCVHQ